MSDDIEEGELNTEESSESEDKHRIIDVRGELDVTMYESITKDEKDKYSECQFVVTITDSKGISKEGVVILSPAKTKKFLQLLNLEGV